ncbi:MAG: Ppx/GppA phosphatase family protein [Pseudomonadota bacterium]
MMTRTGWRFGARRPPPPTFAAIDLGTNNCRLVIATPHRRGFRVVDAYSRIVRLGEGVSKSGVLSEAAMARTYDALKVCAEKMAGRNVYASRCIATQACRSASNGQAFLDRIRRDLGLRLEMVSAEEEAGLAVKGCQDLIDPMAQAAMVFDIGGGSTEMSWLTVHADRDQRVRTELAAWMSIPMGVVTLAEYHGKREMSRAAFDAMTNVVAQQIRSLTVPDPVQTAFAEGAAHLVGTSGTVTSIAGIHLGLKRYVRREVDGLWLSQRNARIVGERLRSMRYERRAEEPCVGPDRADLVVPGCAIFSGILKAWPVARIRVGDRGLREGLLIDLMDEWQAQRSAARSECKHKRCTSNVNLHDSKG